jgi:cobalt-zinc-cadmium efflux system protein
MGHGHAHGGVSAAGKNKKNLAIVLGLTLTYLIAEVIGGLWFNSLALLADAGHMLTDVMGLALALLAIWFAEKPATPERTYGYYRFEILAALTNAVVLIGISLYIVAGIGLVINLFGMWLLYGSSKESLNMKGAYFEVLSDMLTSIGVIIAGIIMLTTGWYYADPLLSAGIGLFILPRTWKLMMDAVGVLLEGTPSDVNIAALRESLEKLKGVAEIHDLHVWSITSGINAMSVHAVLAETAEHDDVLARVHEHCTKKFEISHVTVQTERGDFATHETHL